MKTRSLLLLACACLWHATATAHDFTAQGAKGQTLYFNITDAKNKTVELTYEGNIASKQRKKYSGAVEVMPQVTYKGQTYRVTAIGDKAFSNNEALTQVALPSGITSIGDFAFEGCTRLIRVEFPSNKVKMGKGIFFKCSRLSSVVLGSEWTEVDLSELRWSRQLTSISIPARIKAIGGLEKLNYLKRINVAHANPYFQAIGGVLYNKSGKTLMACPKAYDETLRVADDTWQIAPGAIADCSQLTTIVLPASLEKLSFREFAYLQELRTIVMMAQSPIATARLDGSDVFTLCVANSNVRLIVNKKAKKTYAKRICHKSGEYTELPQDEKFVAPVKPQLLPYIVNEGQTLSEKNIEGVKSFKNYL